MPKRILILSKGRTGSHMLLDSFRRLQVVTGKLGPDNGFDNLNHMLDRYRENDIAVHAHDLTQDVRDNSHGLDLVLNLRKNMFDQAVSHMIAVNSGNYCDYNNRVSKMHISFDSIKIFIEYLYTETCKTIYECNRLKWKSTRIIYYEDFINNVDAYIENNFKLDYRIDWHESKPRSFKRPYDYSDLIINYQQLYKDFRKWKKQHINVFDYPDLKSC